MKLNLPSLEEPCPECGNREFCRSDCPVAPWNSDEQTGDTLPVVSKFRYLMRKRRWTGLPIRRSEERLRKRRSGPRRFLGLGRTAQGIARRLEARGYRVVAKPGQAVCYFGNSADPFSPCNLIVVVTDRLAEAGFHPRSDPFLHVTRPLALWNEAGWKDLESFESIYNRFQDRIP